MSPRTAKYVEAMVREGDSFDYNEWLNRVREEEAQAKQVATGTSGGLAPAQIAAPIKMFDDQHPRPNLALPLTAKTILAQALRRYRQAKNKTPKARPRQWLKNVRRAWREFQANRRRDSVYGYLEAVFAIVEHFRVRRRTNRLLRHAFEFANLPLDKRADPFAAIIHCTSDGGVDNKSANGHGRCVSLLWPENCGPP